MNFGTRGSSKIKNLATYIFPVLGVIIMVAFLGIVWFWESYGREMYLYKEVIIAKDDIKQGTIIKAEMLRKSKEEASRITSNAITNPKDVLGYAAKIQIPKNAQIDKAYIENPEMLLEKDQYIFKLPNEWIKAVPNTLRRKDKGYIYLVNSQLFNIDSRRNEAENSDGSTTPTYPGNQGNIAIETDKDIIETQIAYVKDSANREVVTLSDQERIDGSSTISEVEVILTMEEFQSIERAVAEGYKIMIMYKGQ